MDESDRDHIGDVLEAVRAREFTEILVIGYRDEVGQFEALYSFPDEEFLREMMVAFGMALTNGEYPDTRD